MDEDPIEQLANALRDVIPEWPAIRTRKKHDHWYAYTRVGDRIFGGYPRLSKDDAARSIERDVDRWITRQ